MVIPTFLLVFISILYLLGWLLAAGVGRLMWASFEGMIHRLADHSQRLFLRQTGYGLCFSEQTIEFNRVVAVEYPRKGIWSIGFVTGESLLDIRSAVNEPVLSLLMPTSPLPMTGFTITVRKSETIDLDITIDQAVQYMVSCGVVVPLAADCSASREFIPVFRGTVFRCQAARAEMPPSPTTRLNQRSDGPTNVSAICSCFEPSNRRNLDHARLRN
jgi:uncharacterized membrane protein